MKFHCSCYTFFSSELNWSIFWYSLKRELYNFILWGPLLLVFTKLSLTASYMCESVVFNTTTRVRPKITLVFIRLYPLFWLSAFLSLLCPLFWCKDYTALVLLYYFFWLPSYVPCPVLLELASLLTLTLFLGEKNDFNWIFM